MSKTIEERLSACHLADRKFINYYIRGEHTVLHDAKDKAPALDAAIIADWNAAVKAMMAADALLNRIDELSEDCYDMTAEYFVDDVLPDLAHGDLQAAIAKMEGGE